MFLNLVFNFHCKVCASTFTSSTALPLDSVDSLSGVSSISLSMEFGPVEVLFLKESYCLNFLILVFLHEILHVFGLFYYLN